MEEEITKAELQMIVEEQIERCAIAYLKQETPEAEENLAKWFEIEPDLTTEILGCYCRVWLEEPPDEF
ncbi:MAG: hypothetical protein ABEI32_12395 [Halothece sp.]